MVTMLSGARGSGFRTPVTLWQVQRVHLAPGETRQVTFSIGWDALRFCGPDMNWVVEPGEFTIAVGDSSVQHLTTSLTVQ